jgi:hypothetical protein
MGNITNDTFNPIRAYSNVRLQQGVPLVDADVNELDDVRKFDLRAFLKWFVGNGISIGGDAFHILPALPASATDLLISAGLTTGSVSNTLTSTTATYTQPSNANPSNAPVTVPVGSSVGMAVGEYVALVQADGLFAGLYQVTNLPDGTHVSIARPQNAPGVPTTTTVKTPAKIFLAASDVTTTGLNLVGRILVDGLEVIIPSDKLYSEQVISAIDLGAPYNVPPLPSAIPSGTQMLVFLDVWERIVSTVEDPSLVVQPLNTESCVRTKRLWVVRVRPGASLPGPGDSDFAKGHLYYPLASINRAAANSPITASTITDLRERRLLAATTQNSGGLALILDSNATGTLGARFRAYADASGAVWFTLNASWDGGAWVPDASALFVGGFRISLTDFELFNNDPTIVPITTFTRSWRLPMTGGVNSAFELTGNVQEVGRLGLGFFNTGTTAQFTEGDSAVNFRNRFPSTPSSITFSPLISFQVTGNPIVFFPIRDGFGFFFSSTPNPGTEAYWHGTYTAIA